MPRPPSRLHSNSLRCDCHLSWLSPWLRQRPSLGLYTQCSSPPSLRGLNLAELRKNDFACSGMTLNALPATFPLPHTIFSALPVGGAVCLLKVGYPRPCRTRWRQRLRAALQPGLGFLPSHVHMQQQHCGLSWAGPDSDPRPPARGHDRDVSFSAADLFFSYCHCFLLSVFFLLNILCWFFSWVTVDWSRMASSRFHQEPSPPTRSCDGCE